MSEPTTPTPNRPLLAWLLTRLADQPRWVQALAIALVAAAGAAVQFYRSAPADPVPVQAPQPAPVVNVALPPAQPQPVQGLVEAGRERAAGQRLFGRLVRERVARQLQTDGFKLVGGNATPLGKEKAEELVRRLDDDVVLAGYAEVRGEQVVEGPVLDFFRRILDWIREHPEEFKRLIGLLLTILMAFI